MSTSVDGYCGKPILWSGNIYLPRVSRLEVKGKINEGTLNFKEIKENSKDFDDFNYFDYLNSLYNAIERDFSPMSFEANFLSHSYFSMVFGSRNN